MSGAPDRRGCWAKCAVPQWRAGHGRARQIFYGIPHAPVMSLADARRIWDSDSVQWISVSEKLGITLE